MNRDIDNNGQSYDETSKKLQEVSSRSSSPITNRVGNRMTGMPSTPGARRPIRQMNENVPDKLGNNQLVQNSMNKKTNSNPAKTVNHQRPNLGVLNNTDDTKANNPKNQDIGSRNLQNSLTNKAKNLWLQRKKKKNTQNSGSDDSNTEQDDNNANSASDVLDNMVSGAKRRLKIKIIIYSTIIGVILLMAMSIFMAIFGVDITQSIPAIGHNTYDTDYFESVYEEGTNEYKNEIAYYEKLQEVIKKYEEENGDEIKANYIHAVLIYLYYQIDNGEISEKDNNSIIDYEKMTKMVDKIVPLLIPSDESKTIDYEKKGDYYNRLKESEDFKEYYKEVLKNKKIDDLLDEIFDLAKELDDMITTDDTVITTETTVTVTETATIDKNGGAKTTKTLSVNSFVLDSIYATTSSIGNTEMIKAYTIAYSTNIVANNKKLTIDSSSAAMNGTTCSIEKGCSYDKNGNLVDGAGERSSKNSLFYNGGYYYKKPLSSDEITNLNGNVNSVLGNVLVKSDGTYPTLDISKIDGLGGDYKTILQSGYGNNYTIKNIGEDSYIIDGSFGTVMVKTNVITYDQGDYGSYSFCGLKNETIKSSGCGVTSMAMVVSTYEKDNKYDPIYMNKEAMNKKMCGAGSGTAQAFFGKEAGTMNYKYLGGSKHNKNILNLVLKHLSQGHLVVVRMGPGHFTGGGHYMVLGGIDPSTKKVYVYDPNNKSNSGNWRKTGNGWYSFNDIIVKEAYNFYIIWKG